MDKLETLLQQQVSIREAEDGPSALDRIGYLCPSRYFRFFMLYDRSSNSTCWLPEGYNA